MMIDRPRETEKYDRIEAQRQLHPPNWGTYSAAPGPTVQGAAYAAKRGSTARELSADWWRHETERCLSTTEYWVP